MTNYYLLTNFLAVFRLKKREGRYTVFNFKRYFYFTVFGAILFFRG